MQKAWEKLVTYEKKDEVWMKGLLEDCEYILKDLTKNGIVGFIFEGVHPKSAIYTLLFRHCTSRRNIF